MFPPADWLAQAYAGNTWLIGRLVDGLTSADSLAQPPFVGNCLNWVLGHILSRRQTALALLGQDGFWGEAEMEKYRTGSAAITDSAAALPWERLLADLAQSEALLQQALAAATPEALAQVGVTDRGQKPVAEHLDGLVWHETYHIGQLEVLRAMALWRREEING